MEKTKAEAAAAPARPLTLGGRTYLIAEPNISTMASIISVVRKRMVTETPLAALVNDPAFAKLPPPCQLEATREASRVQATGSKPINGMALLDELMRPATLAFAVWVLARSSHPELTLEAVRAEITEDNVDALFVSFTEASGMMDGSKLGNLSGLLG